MANKLPDWMPDEEDTFQSPTAPGSPASVPLTSSLAPKIQPNTQRKGTSGFTNLKKYIQANKDSNLANTVTSQAQSKLNSAGQQLNDTQNQFQTGLAGEKGKLQGASGEATKAINYIDTGAQAPGQGQAPAAFSGIKPTDTFATNYAKDLEDYNKQFADSQQKQDEYNAKANEAAKNSLNTLKNYTYGGPLELANQNQLASNKAEIQDFAKATGSEAGRGAILQTLFGKRGQYSGGARNLDTALLGANPDALNKLRDIRSQANQYTQNLQQANQQAAAGVGTARSTVDVEKAKNALAMKQLRDSLKARLEAEAGAYNTAQQADVAQIDSAELQKWLPELAGYETTTNPHPITNLGAIPRVGNPNPNGLDVPVPITNAPVPATNPFNSGMHIASQIPVLDDRMHATGGIDLPVANNPTVPLTPEQQAYVNLYQNKGFEDRQIVDPNRTVDRHVEENHGSSDMSGAPNRQQAYINTEALRPLFKESYTDNTWDSINKSALERRNILSQVLQDDAENGVLTPKQRNEIQVELNQPLLTNLKETPKMAEENYNTNFYSGAPGTTVIQAIDAYKDLANDTDPFKYMQEAGIDAPLGLVGGATLSQRDAPRWNPTTKKVEVTNLKKVLVGPNGQESSLAFDDRPLVGGWYDPKTGQHYTGDSLKNYTVKEVPHVTEMTGAQFMDQNRVLFGLKGFNTRYSIPGSAKKLQEKYILDRLKNLGFESPSLKVV